MELISSWLYLAARLAQICPKQQQVSATTTTTTATLKLPPTPTRYQDQKYELTASLVKRKSYLCISLVGFGLQFEKSLIWLVEETTTSAERRTTTKASQLTKGKLLVRIPLGSVLVFGEPRRTIIVDSHSKQNNNIHDDDDGDYKFRLEKARLARVTLKSRAIRAVGRCCCCCCCRWSIAFSRRCRLYWPVELLEGLTGAISLQSCCCLVSFALLSGDSNWPDVVRLDLIAFRGGPKQDDDDDNNNKLLCVQTWQDIWQAEWSSQLAWLALLLLLLSKFRIQSTLPATRKQIATGQGDPLIAKLGSLHSDDGGQSGFGHVGDSSWPPGGR